MTDFRTPLSRARGNGAAGHGAAHWVAERVSAIATVHRVVIGFPPQPVIAVVAR